jgi:cytochrome c oxidase cbb3-type subunit II
MNPSQPWSFFKGMNQGPFLISGIVFTVAFSAWGLVFAPRAQLADLEPAGKHPLKPSELVARGQQVYVDLGCVYCHSQQVRHDNMDVARGWGRRPSVARDYIHDPSPLLGTMRTGPDLRNIGARQPSEDWHYLHLYNPQITSRGSVMPEYPFLFNIVEERRDFIPIGALELPEGSRQRGHYIIPTERAEALVAYLKSLRAEAPVPELGGVAP